MVKNRFGGAGVAGIMRKVMSALFTFSGDDRHFANGANALASESAFHLRNVNQSSVLLGIRYFNCAVRRSNFINLFSGLFEPDVFEQFF